MYIIPRDINVVVASYGGAATTLIMTFLQKNGVQTNDPSDRDYCKHLPLPPCSLNRNVRIIYIISDPVDAVGSLFRRNYQWRSFRKYTRRWITCPPALESLERYWTSGEDILMLRSHYTNWTSVFQRQPTLVVPYERLWDQAGTWLEFVGLPSSLISSLPEQRPRKTEALFGLLGSQATAMREWYSGVLNQGVRLLPKVKGFNYYQREARAVLWGLCDHASRIGAKAITGCSFGYKYNSGKPDDIQ
jgi:hypothetical protein